jgi:hypothetical protein
MAALSSRLWRAAQRQMLLNGMMKFLPSFVREYSTAMDLDRVTRLSINPVDSRLRSVLVSILCEMFPKRRRSCPWRYGPDFSMSMISTVHLPMKIVGTISDPRLSLSFIFVASSLRP